VAVLPISGVSHSVSFRTMSSELLRKPLHYDGIQRRLWIRGQRCHHGATGALLAGAGMVAAGGVLMAHDWHDRALWFAKGWQA
jgi:hypothetical protein